MSFFEIDCDMTALVENYRVLRETVGDFFAVVKCNAYGHGLQNCVSALYEAGCDRFAVVKAGEAFLTRQLASEAEILLLSRAEREYIPELFGKNITLTVFSEEYANEIYPYLTPNARLHLKVETAMNRSGLRPCEIPRGYFGLADNIFGIYTHFPRVFDREETLETVARFGEISNETESRLGRKILKHCASSQASIEIPESRFDSSRIGIALYGAYPCKALTPVMTAKSRVISVHTARKGERVGYGSYFICERDTVVATVCGGYADGLLRSGKNRLTASINGHKATVCGVPCMDRTMFDITPIFENGGKVKVGDEVLFFGRGKSVIEAARECETIPYEMLTSAGGRE